MTMPATEIPDLGLPPLVPPMLPPRARLDDPTVVYALALLLCSRQRDLSGGLVRRDGPVAALRPMAAALGGSVLRASFKQGREGEFAWICDDAGVRHLVWAAREDADVASRLLAAIPDRLRIVALLGAWDARGTAWVSAPGLAYAAIGGPTSVLVALREMVVALGLAGGSLAGRRDIRTPDELRIGGDGQVARLQRLVMEAVTVLPASQRVRVREPMPRLRLLVQAEDRTRVIRYPVPSRDGPAMGQTVIHEEAEVDVRLLAIVLGMLDGMQLLSPAERVWGAVVLLGLAGLEPGRPWREAEGDWHTQVEMLAWARSRCSLTIIQPRFSSVVRQLEAVGLAERDDTRRRYRLSRAALAAFARCGAERPSAQRMAVRLEAALRRYPQPRHWLELPTPVTIGAREIHRLPRVGQSEVLALALSHADLAWPATDTRVIWLDEGRTELMKDAAALSSLGLGARLGGGGPRPDLMLLTRDDATGRDLLVVGEACSSHGPVTRTREQKLRHFLAGLRPGVDVQLVTLVLREEHLEPWRRDLADDSWVWIAERLMTDDPALVPATVLMGGAR